ncbi:MAG: aldehyde dehydrogenase family protein [Rhodocyclaceae bacterium]|nr:aldehyde dehydrogenase family protein [Rhodocyclaceae bacterium]
MLHTAIIEGRQQLRGDETLVDVRNPATGEVLAALGWASPSTLVEAIDAAEAAAKAWTQTLAKDRELILLKAAEAVERRRARIVDLLTTETGSTLAKAHWEVAFVINMLRSAAGECRRIFGDTLPSDTPGLMSFAIRQPLGVIAAICPFNFPFLLSMKKVCMALAAGNTVVLKPAEEASLVGLEIGAIFEDAGLPDGVLNIVPGDGEVLGPILTSDPRIKLVSFTGSTAVGRKVAVACARVGKKHILEMGGKSPLVVLNDADLVYAARCATLGIFFHQGQICMASSRLIVEAGVYDRFAEIFTGIATRLTVGDPQDPGTVVGPLIRAEQCKFIAAQIADACAGGARVLCGGTYDGPFFSPTIVADVPTTSRLFREESFGPVVSLIRAEDFDHALALANDTSYGLSASVITNDLQKAMTFALKAHAGMVHVNGPTAYDEPHVPMGGVGDSGFGGRESGTYNMDEMTELKWITVQLGERPMPI